MDINQELILSLSKLNKAIQIASRTQDYIIKIHAKNTKELDDIWELRDLAIDLRDYFEGNIHNFNFEVWQDIDSDNTNRLLVNSIHHASNAILQWCYSIENSCDGLTYMLNTCDKLITRLLSKLQERTYQYETLLQTKRRVR